MRFFGLLSVICLCSIAALAQTATGTITGTISDPAGAVVSGAPIELKNSETGTVNQTVSSSTGNYSFSQLPAATYQLTVNVPGFKTHVRQNLGVQSAQTIRVDIILEVGTNTESVTVSAEASMLTTESGAVSANVTTDRMNSLPILGVGPATSSTHGVRNPLASSVLTAGVFWVPNTSMRVNGAPTNTFGIKLDGQDITNGVNTSSSQAQMQPSVDALEEVAIQASNYSAEFGQAGSGLIQYTTKSGTNIFHGSAYDYFVNEALWAHHSFDHIRNKQRRNDFGGTIGGPVIIPKLYNGKDKTFFFFNYERFRETSVVSDQVTTVPTLNYRAGNFANLLDGRPLTGAAATDGLGNKMFEGMIFDPATEQTAPNGTRVRLQFPGNIIPSNRFDPSAVKLQNLIPKPNLGPPTQLTNNFVNPFPSNRATPIPSIKIDHSLSSKLKIGFYWSSTSTEVQYAPGGFALSEGFPDEVTQTRGTYIYSRTWRGNMDYTLTPTMLLHFGAGYVVNDFGDTAPITNFDMVKVLGISGGTLGPTTGARVPVWQSTLGLNSTGGTPVMGPSTGQVRALLQRPTGNLSLNWVKGNHSYKFGGEVRFDGYPTVTNSNTSGNFTFSTNQTDNSFFSANQAKGGLFTGFAYASLLLGAPNSVTLAQPAETRGGRGFYAWYAQDTWKVTRKLTLDYGIRWDLFTYPREQYGRSPDFSPTLANANAGGHPGATIYEANCNCRFAKNYPWAYAPRLGVSYQVASKTVLRGAIGLSYSMSQGGGQGSAGANQTATSQSFGDPVMILSNGIPIKPLWPDLRANLFPTTAGTVGSGASVPPRVDQNYGRPARMVQYNIDLQREISRDLVVEASYVGNRGVWWRTASLLDYNALTPQQLLSQYGLDWSNAADRAILASPLNLAAAGRFQNKVPYAGFPVTQTVAQSLRPFPQFAAIGATGAPLGKTWYDSLQVKATKRFSHGIDFTFTYTRSKELQLGAEDYTGLGLINDVFNRDNNKQLSSSSRPNWMTFATNYTTPKWGQNRWLSYALRDWMIGAVLQYGSGLPIAVPLNTNNNNASTLLRGAGWSTRVPGVPLYLVDLNCHCYDPSKTQVLNPAAWTDSPSGTFTPSAAYYNDFRYQRRPSELASFGRTFHIKERLAFQIRAEFNNVFNRSLLQGTTPGTYINPSTTRNAALTPSPVDGRFVSGFGTINTTGTISGERQGTIVARLTF
ncbi:MAG: TonB-dependent receptor [Acidobacteriia bacterium]|nr:TonB-dependent receptor [Terriglobia bacterium]